MICGGRPWYDLEVSAVHVAVALDDDLVNTAVELTGVSETPALLRLSLATLIQVESAKRLAALGGTDPKAEASPEVSR